MSYRQEPNLILTGMMGAGKTTVGRLLAERMGRQFMDVDEEIEKVAGCSIARLIGQKGENHFRELESAVLTRILHRSGQVVATGGGAVIRQENRKQMAAAGYVVWLALQWDEARKRLSLDGTRPLLLPPGRIADDKKGASSDGDAVTSGLRPSAAEGDPGSQWQKLEEERRLAYSLCDWVVDASRPVETVVAAIIDWWERLIASHLLSPISADSGPFERKPPGLIVDVKEGAYGIHIGRGIRANLGERCRAQMQITRALVISNPTVWKLYGNDVVESLRAAGIRCSTALMPDGEQHKKLTTVADMYDAAVEAGLDRRRSAIIALGGGVVGDVAGFVAATYMRGIPLIQVPTTLLAQVDSSVGGKTGVNHPGGKNLIGAFYQPRMVLVDIETLQTLPVRQFLTGMAEIVKYGLIADKDLLTEIEAVATGGYMKSGINSLPAGVLAAWIRRSCEIKAAVVAVDAREQGYREILNFGHTIGHAMEKVAGYGRYTHGEAVAIGMVTAAILSHRRGYIDAQSCRRVVNLLQRLGLPTTYGDISPQELIRAAAFDKKVINDRVRFVLLEELGKARMAEVVEPRELEEALQVQQEDGYANSSTART